MPTRKSYKAVLPVASLWASSDYKCVANSPIRVSQILYLTILISEIYLIKLHESLLHLGKRFSYHIGNSYGK
jgi:hypothetical protein